MKRLALAPPALALIFTACGGGPTLPLGPGGGENTVEVMVDGLAEDFDSLGATARSESGTVSIQLLGNRDPVKNAIDDEYAYVLNLDLDEGSVARLASLGFSLTFSATVSYSEVEGVFRSTLESEGLLDPIRNIDFRRSCFCAPTSGSYTVEGEFVLTGFNQTSIQGSIDFTFKGMIPNDNASEIRISSNFDLAVEVLEAN